jgi:hypothetical protein
MIRKNLLCLILALLTEVVFSQTQDQTRQYICEKLVVYYIDNPSVVPPSDMTTIEVDKNAIFNNQDLTTGLWTNTNNSGLKDLLIKLLRGSSNGGDLQLQRIVRNVLLIKDQKVKVYLFGDFAGGAQNGWPIYCSGGSNYPTGKGNCSWPCANTISTTGFTGHISLGAYFYSASYGLDVREKTATFIHELTHTQIPLINDASLTIDMYGPDGNHFVDEAIPSKGSAFNEGIANAFSFRYFIPDYGKVSNAFQNNSSIFVESVPTCGPLPPPLQCLQTRLSSASVASSSTGTCFGGSSCGGANLCYNIRNMPPDVLLHWEMVSSAILYQYISQFRSEIMLVRNVKTILPTLSRGVYPLTPLFKEMVKSGMNYRPANAPAGSTTFGQHLPIGIFDFYTGYKLSSKSDLETALGTTWLATDTNIDSYFTNHRSTLLGFRASAQEWRVKQLDRFAENLNVRIVNPQPAAPSTRTGN